MSLIQLIVTGSGGVLIAALARFFFRAGPFTHAGAPR